MSPVYYAWVLLLMLVEEVSFCNYVLWTGGRFFSVLRTWCRSLMILWMWMK